MSARTIADVIRWRYVSLVRRSMGSNAREPPKEFVDRLTQHVVSRGQLCHYCSNRVDLSPAQGNPRTALSLDHKVAFSRTHDNSLENIVISCARCNFAKGIMPYDTFMLLVNALKPDRAALERVLNSLYDINTWKQKKGYLNKDETVTSSSSFENRMPGY